MSSEDNSKIIRLLKALTEAVDKASNAAESQNKQLVSVLEKQNDSLDAIQQNTKDTTAQAADTAEELNTQTQAVQELIDKLINRGLQTRDSSFEEILNRVTSLKEAKDAQIAAIDIQIADLEERLAKIPPTQEKIQDKREQTYSKENVDKDVAASKDFTTKSPPESKSTEPSTPSKSRESSTVPNITSTDASENKESDTKPSTVSLSQSTIDELATEIGNEIFIKNVASDNKILKALRAIDDTLKEEGTKSRALQMISGSGGIGGGVPTAAAVAAGGLLGRSAAAGATGAATAGASRASSGVMGKILGKAGGALKPLGILAAGYEALTAMEEYGEASKLTNIRERETKKGEIAGGAIGSIAGSILLPALVGLATGGIGLLPAVGLGIAGGFGGKQIGRGFGASAGEKNAQKITEQAIKEYDDYMAWERAGGQEAEDKRLQEFIKSQKEADLKRPTKTSRGLLLRYAQDAFSGSPASVRTPYEAQGSVGRMGRTKSDEEVKRQESRPKKPQSNTVADRARRVLEEAKKDRELREKNTQTPRTEDVSETAKPKDIVKEVAPSMNEGESLRQAQQRAEKLIERNKKLVNVAKVAADDERDKPKESKSSTEPRVSTAAQETSPVRSITSDASMIVPTDDSAQWSEQNSKLDDIVRAVQSLEQTIAKGDIFANKSMNMGASNSRKESAPSLPSPPTSAPIEKIASYTSAAPIASTRAFANQTLALSNAGGLLTR
jgi:DNA-binding MarR family transcriptional regulator